MTSLHPIATAFSLCLTEKNTIASKSALSQIKGNFMFDSDEINMLSIQLMNGLQISKIIPENRFTVKFEVKELQEILNQGKSSQKILLILLSSIAWLIEAERTKKAENFGLVLNLLESISPQISIIYQITNYFFVSILKSEIELPFHDIETQINKFVEKYKNLPNFVDNTILLWLQICYSTFKPQTAFAQSILVFTAHVYEQNQYLFSEEVLNNLCYLLNPYFSALDQMALFFLIQVAHILPSNILFETTNYLIDSILYVFESKGCVYPLFDKEKYQEPFTYEFPTVSAYSLQFPKDPIQYDNVFALPQFPFDPDFRISSQITVYTNYIIKILLRSPISPLQYSSSFAALLKNALKSFHFLDVVAAILSILIFVDQIELNILLKVLIDSPLFDSAVTIFTNNSESESIHKLRMLTYKFIIFPDKRNCSLFFNTKIKYPLIIAEFFYYAFRMQIPYEILKSDSFVHHIYSLILTYQDNNNISSSNSNKQLENIKSDTLDSDLNKENEETLQNENNDGIFDVNEQNDREVIGDYQPESLSLTNDDVWENTLFFEINPSKPLLVPNEFEQVEPIVASEENNLKLGEDQAPTQRKLRLVYSQSIPVLEDMGHEKYSDDDNDHEESISPLVPENNVDIRRNDEMEDTENLYNEVTIAAKSLQTNEMSDVLENEINDENNDNIIDDLDEDNVQIYSNNRKQIHDEIHHSFEVIKVNHKEPLNDADNFIFIWLNEVKKVDCATSNPNNLTTTSQHLRCALVYILSFIIKAIEDNDSLASHWNLSTGFIPALFSLIFDDHMRSVVISIIKKIWSIVKQKEIEEVSQGCILAIFQQNYDDNFALLDLQILEMINNQLESCKHISGEPFNQLCPIITSILAGYDISSSFLHNSMLFFAYLPKGIKRATRTAILAAIQRTEGKEQDRQFFNDFILLITSVENKKFSSNYLITQPKMVSIFVDAFIESPLLNDAIVYIDSLCKNSFANSRACHKGKVDLSLLKFISNRTNNDILPAISLLSKIALSASSMPVVNHFISLFCPIKSNFSPPYLPEMVQTLTNIIIARQCQPIASFPLSRISPTVKILRLTGSHLNQGFTCVFKLFIDQFACKFQPKLLTLTDKKQTLTISLFNTHITIFNSLQPSVTFSSLIPTNTWTNLAISFLPSKKQVELHIHNISYQKPVIMPYNFIDFHFTTLSCEIGGGDTSSPNIEQATMIGNFALYSYSENPNFDFSSTNVSGNNKNVFPIISLSFESEQSLLCIRKNYQSDLEAVLNGHNVIQTLSLPDVLVRFFKAEILIPLFAQVDLPILDTNDQLPSTFSGKILSLLAATLQLSDEAQNSFEQSNGFSLIAYILISNSPRNLTFDLYMHFILLFESITCHNLKLQLFSCILINAEIWSLASQDVKHQVLYHWDQHLFVDYTDLFLRLQPFSKLIHTVSYFYWRSKNKPDSDMSDDQRTLIFQLLCAVAEKQFTLEDSQALFMTCVGSPDTRFSEDLLLLIKMMAQNPNSPFRRIEGREILYYSMHILLSCDYERLTLKVIDAILSLQSSQIIKSINVINHVDILMTKIRKNFFTETFVAGLIKMSYSYPEVLPIPCFITATCGGSILSTLINELHPNQEYSSHKMWFIWPLIVAIKFKESTDFMIDFIIMSSKKDWQNIFVGIEIVAQCLSDDYIPIQRLFLLQLSKYFLELKSINSNNSEFEQCLEQYLELCQYFILTKPKDRSSKALHVAFAVSPFIEGNEMEIVSYDSYGRIPKMLSSTIQFFESSEFFNTKMVKLSQSMQSTKFALDLNENGEWLDKELSNDLIKVVKKYKNKRFSDFADYLGKPECSQLHEIYEANSEYINKISYMITEYSNFIVNNRICSLSFEEMLKPRLEKFYIDCFSYINNEDRRMKADRDKTSKLWQHLWRQLTLERAPWRNALPQSSSHFKRNNRILAYFCPVKLKINMDFNEHKDASFKRDFGSAVTAKQHFEEYQNTLEKQYRKEAPPPLLTLNDDFINQTNSNLSNVQNDNIENNEESGRIEIEIAKEKCQQYKASLLTIDESKEVNFCLYRKKIQIIDNDNEVKTIEASNVSHILFRSFMHHERAFEIVTKSGKSYLINLLQLKSLDLLKIISRLPAFENALIQTVPPNRFVKSINIQEKWCHGVTSNFEYLMQLNFFGGRTFNETAMYPVFPWILKDYSSETIDLENPEIYRDLSTPMGALTQQRLKELQAHMKDYMAIRNVGFLYNSCYISPLCVFLWLIRMEPFTTLHIKLQSGKFDHAARLFSSIPSAYHMASTHMNDYRELIPEFFYTSSFLENRNNFDLGKVNNKRIVDDAILPRWANSAIDFIYTHRKALESDYVSQHLNQWIDLIFGYKQRGPEAVKNNNTFDPCLYENIWTETNLNDPGQRAMIEALLQHCGHIPNQLFTEPHPPKTPFKLKSIVKRSSSFQTGIACSVFTKIFDYSPSSMKILFCTDDGKVSIASTSFNSTEEKGVTCSLAPNNYEIDLGLTTHSKIMETISYNPKTYRIMATTDTGGINITNLLTKKEITLFQHIGRVNCVTCSENYIVSGGADTTINIWDNGKTITHLKTVPSFRSEITCLHINDKFGTIACGTKDGSILLIDTASMVTTNVIDIAPEVPMMIRITSGWGFVVVYSTRASEGRIVPSLTLFDIDGQFIRKKRLNSPISCWDSYVSIDGFDYMTIANDIGGLFLFEVFYLNVEDSGVPRNSSRILALKYSLSKSVLIAVRENGTVCVYSSSDLNTKYLKRSVFGINV